MAADTTRAAVGAGFCHRGQLMGRCREKPSEGEGACTTCTRSLETHCHRAGDRVTVRPLSERAPVTGERNASLGCRAEKRWGHGEARKRGPRQGRQRASLRTEQGRNQTSSVHTEEIGEGWNGRKHAHGKYVSVTGKTDKQEEGIPGVGQPGLREVHVKDTARKGPPEKVTYEEGAEGGGDTSLGRGDSRCQGEAGGAQLPQEYQEASVIEFPGCACPIFPVLLFVLYC